MNIMNKIGKEQIENVRTGKYTLRNNFPGYLHRGLRRTENGVRKHVLDITQKIALRRKKWKI